MSSLSTVMAFTVASLKQQARDRSSFFFMLVLPVAIMVIIGATFGGAQDTEIMVVRPAADDPAPADHDRLLVELRALSDVSAEFVDTLDEGREALRRSDVEGVLVRTGTEATAGEVEASTDGWALVVDERSSSATAARTLALRALNRLAVPADTPLPEVEISRVGEATFASSSPFSLTSAQNLVLFTFITALTAGTLIVRARKAGVLRRAMSTPAGVGSITLGLGGSWFVLALVQSLIIFVIGAVGFGVRWGDPVAGVALLVAFALIGSGAGVLVGALFPSEDQVSSIGPPLALVLAALGGCMVPTEVFPDSVLNVSRLTPHYWALESWKDLIFDGAGVADIGSNLAVLVAYAVGLLALAAVALRRTLST